MFDKQCTYAVSEMVDLHGQSWYVVDSWLTAMVMKIVLLQIVLIDNCADKRGLKRPAAPTTSPLIDHCAKIVQKMSLYIESDNVVAQHRCLLIF